MSNQYRLAALGAVAVCAALTFAGGASAYTMKTLYTFCSQHACADGIQPNALTMDPAGNLYGSTYDGGDRRKGVIFELIPNADKSAWTYEVLYRFCAGCIGRPEGKLVLDTAGNLYGVTHRGGHTQGAVVELSPSAGRSSWTLTELHSFIFCRKDWCANGYYSQLNALAYAGSETDALYDGVSPLYGTSALGGGNRSGFVFQLTPQDGGFRYRNVYDFCTAPHDPICDGGGITYAPAYVDPHGNLFLTTNAYSVYGGGGIVELTPPRSHGKFTATKLYDFCSPFRCPFGNFATAAMIPDAQGNLYGTTQLGGSTGEGVVFKLAPDGQSSQYTVLYNFCPTGTCDDGRVPSSGPLTMDSAGHLFGTTQWGGIYHNDPITSGGGTVFELNGTHQTLYNFCAATDCSDGQEPTGGLMMDA
ncbi:MAG TPA: choice-of-anchor tandem repeat GloVer-containing protein, partial [Rhizomicrobium sp.]|nr:choice-of-anchor tandem repeat GloVer-containing protein [Rhizomicrobium sp.]